MEADSLLLIYPDPGDFPEGTVDFMKRAAYAAESGSHGGAFWFFYGSM
jgi:hypothetical protein